MVAKVFDKYFFCPFHDKRQFEKCGDLFIDYESCYTYISRLNTNHQYDRDLQRLEQIKKESEVKNTQ